MRSSQATACATPGSGSSIPVPRRSPCPGNGCWSRQRHRVRRRRSRPDSAAGCGRIPGRLSTGTGVTSTLRSRRCAPPRLCNNDVSPGRPPRHWPDRGVRDRFLDQRASSRCGLDRTPGRATLLEWSSLSAFGPDAVHGRFLRRSAHRRRRGRADLDRPVPGPARKRALSETGDGLGTVTGIEFDPGTGVISTILTDCHDLAGERPDRARVLRRDLRGTGAVEPDNTRLGQPRSSVCDRRHRVVHVACHRPT